MNTIVFKVKRVVFGFLIVLFLLGGWTSDTTLGIAAPGSPKPVVNVTYYVDAVLGDDDNDGKSPETAWKTLERVSQTKYGPGNKILLHRGDSWEDQTLSIGNGGYEMGLYLSGFSAGDPIEETMTNLRNSNIPELTYGTIDKVASLDLTTGTVPETMVEFGSYGDPNNPDPIVRNVSIQWTTGIYVHNIVALYYSESTYTTLMQRCMNIVLDNYTTSGIYTDYSRNVRLKDMLSENSIEHGLYLCHESTNFIIENCIFRDNVGSGIQTNGEDMNPAPDDTIIVKRCRIYGNGISGYNDVRSRNMVFYRNLFVSGVQKAIEVMGGSLDNKYYHNVFVSTVAGRPAIGMSNAQNNSFANNIFYVQTDALTTGGSVISSDYNGLYAEQRTDHSPIFDWSRSLAQWQSATGQDAHSMVADPQFVSFDIEDDPANWDLHLKSTSPLIDKGTTISATLGESYTFKGAGPDIGMYEYVPSLTLHGAPGNRTIYLTWSVSVAPSATATWQIDYYTQTVTSTVVVTDALTNTARAYTLTGLDNYVPYTVTLSTVGVTPPLSDTVCVMPTGIFVYLPLVWKEGGN